MAGNVTMQKKVISRFLFLLTHNLSIYYMHATSLIIHSQLWGGLQSMTKKLPEVDYYLSSSWILYNYKISNWILYNVWRHVLCDNLSWSGANLLAHSFWCYSFSFSYFTSFPECQNWSKCQIWRSVWLVKFLRAINLYSTWTCVCNHTLSHNY